jgi:hypothetical protein
VFIPAGLFAGVALLYLAIPTRVLFWDGAGFALAVDHPGWFKMIEPNHPIYIGFGWAVHALAPWTLGITVLQALNAVLGACAVLMVYALRQSRWPVLQACLFAFSATWWKFSTDADAYVPSVLLLLVAAFLLMPDRPARPIVVALVHTFAMLFHELAVLFTVPALIALSGQGGGIAQYLVTAFAATSAAYFLCFHFATGQWGLAEYWHWITWHTPDSSFSFNVARNAWLSLRGTARLFVGGKFGQFHSGFLELAILLALVGVGALFVLKAEPATERPRPTAFLVSWIAVYVVFLFFWLPQNTFYRLFYLPPVILLLRGRPRVLYAALCLLGAWNYLFYIHPDSLVQANPLVVAGQTMRAVWKPGTWVYLGSFNADNWTVFCFDPQVNFKNLDRRTLAAEIEEFARAGRETWIDQSGIDLLSSDPAGRQWLAEHTRPGFRRTFPDPKHRISFDRLFP